MEHKKMQKETKQSSTFSVIYLPWILQRPIKVRHKEYFLARDGTYNALSRNGHIKVTGVA